MNEQQSQIDMLRAAKARELLDNSVLTEALDLLEKDVYRLWLQCPARDDDGKERLWRLAKTAQTFRTILMEFIKTGEYAEAQLLAQEKSRSLFQRFTGVK